MSDFVNIGNGVIVIKDKFLPIKPSYPYCSIETRRIVEEINMVHNEKDNYFLVSPEVYDKLLSQI